jgi:membrane-bound lytic murein transglycosylase B
MTVKLALSARNRLRTQNVATALSVAWCVFAAAGPAEAQTSVPKAPLQITQAQPQQPVPQGQPFEEEIIPQRYANNPDVDGFINDMVARYDFDPAALHTLFASVSYSATAVKLVTPSPTPSIKNWRVYQSRFLDPVRINAGVRFWRNNQATLQRAYEEFGVPPEVIVGILGVETIYGRFMGNFRTAPIVSRPSARISKTIWSGRAIPKSTRPRCSAPTRAQSAFRNSCRAASCSMRSPTTATSRSICAAARPMRLAAWRII